MQPYIVCPKCGMISHNPNDVRERYCGHCHAFHADLLPAGSVTAPASCPTCGAVELVEITCLDDSRWKYLCVGCGATIEGELIDPEYAAAERRKFDALAKAMRRDDRGE